MFGIVEINISLAKFIFFSSLFFLAFKRYEILWIVSHCIHLHYRVWVDF